MKAMASAPPTNTGDQYMLYRFNTKDGWITNNDIAYNAGSIDTTYQECVPISDLAAYYQLYDGSMRSRGGIASSAGIWP